MHGIPLDKKLRTYKLWALTHEKKTDHFIIRRRWRPVFLFFFFLAKSVCSDERTWISVFLFLFRFVFFLLHLLPLRLFVLVFFSLPFDIYFSFYLTHKWNFSTPIVHPKLYYFSPLTRWVPHDGYIRHQNDHLSGHMTDISVMGEWQVAGVGGTRPLWNVLGETNEGRFSFEARNYLFSFQSYVRFEEFFVSRAFERFGAKCSSSGAFGFDDVLGLFLKTPLLHRAFFANSDYDHKYFLKISFLFSKAEPVLLAWQLWRPQVWAKHFGDGTSKTRMKTRLQGIGEIERRRTIDRRRDWYESCAVINGPEEEKTQGSQRVIVRRLNPSSSTNQRVLRSLFPRLGVATVSHFAVFVDVDVPLQDGQPAAREQRRKAVIRDISGVDHWGITNLSAPIWFTGQRHCTVFRHVMRLSLLVLCWKSTLAVILPQIKKKRSLSNVGHRGTKAENLAWHSTG